jgi:hypothetical protein
MKEFDMELIKRFIKQYIKGRKKEKTEILTQYLAIVPIKRDTAQKGSDDLLKGNLREMLLFIDKFP